MAEPVTEEYLRKNMRHRELRLDRMLFTEYPWAERRFYWLNDGGSHHFGAARCQACSQDRFGDASRTRLLPRLVNLLGLTNLRKTTCQGGFFVYRAKDYAQKEIISRRSLRSLTQFEAIPPSISKLRL
ncbi:TPA: DUF6685 family protein [Salmonella enterica subsp. enterica serovar Muenchen]